MLRIMGVMLLCLAGMLFFFCEADDEDECGGARVGGHCWYLGELNQSCAEVCASRGGYNAGTDTYAGHGGTADHCVSVLSALKVWWNGVADTNGTNLGCFYFNDGSQAFGSRDSVDVTNETAKKSYAARACACNR